MSTFASSLLISQTLLKLRERERKRQTERYGHFGQRHVDDTGRHTDRHRDLETVIAGM